MNYRMIPKYIERGIAAKIIGMMIEKTTPNFLMKGVYFLWFRPSVWKDDWNPWSR